MHKAVKSFVFCHTRLNTDISVISYLFCLVKYCQLPFGKVICNSENLMQFPPHCCCQGSWGPVPSPGHQAAQWGQAGMSAWASVGQWLCTDRAVVGAGPARQPLFKSSSRERRSGPCLRPLAVFVRDFSKATSSAIPKLALGSQTSKRRKDSRRALAILASRCSSCGSITCL